MQGRYNRWHLSGALAALGCLLIARLVVGEHIPSLAWMARYTNASGTYCCSERDCVPAVIVLPRAWVFGTEEKQLPVLVNGALIQIPTQNMHHSEDGQAYWCCKTDAEGRCPGEPTAANTRCVFWAEGV